MGFTVEPKNISVSVAKARLTPAPSSSSVTAALSQHQRAPPPPQKHARALLEVLTHNSEAPGRRRPSGRCAPASSRQTAPWPGSPGRRRDSGCLCKTSPKTWMCTWAPLTKAATNVWQLRSPALAESWLGQIVGAPAGTASPLPFRDGIASPVMCCMLTCASPYTMVPSSGTCERQRSAQVPHKRAQWEPSRAGGVH